MAWIELPQQSRHWLIRSCDPYSTSAKPNIQFIFNRIGPVDSQHVRALRAASLGEDSGAGRRQDCNCGSWLEREP